MRFSANVICWLVAAVVLSPSIASGQSKSPTAGGKSSPGDRVAGIVVSKADGHPLSRARVVLAGVKNRRIRESVITTDDGKFEFNGVPAGKYSLGGAHRGFISAGYDQHDQYASAIVTGAGIETDNLVLKLAPDAVISGRVLDETGEAVRQATVTLYIDDHSSGVHQIHASRGGRTNDLGVYELPSLNPGTYFLSVTAEPWYAIHPERDSSQSQGMVDPAVDVAYPVTYYPDVTEADDAAPISIHGGERLQLDVHLSPVPALRLVIHVPAAKGNGTGFPQLEQTAFGDSIPVQSHGAVMKTPGTWEIGGIPAGRYNLRLTGGSMSAQINGIDLTSNAQEVDASAGEALCTLKVSLSNPHPMDSTSQFFVALVAKNRTFPGVFQPDLKGEADFDNIPAGRYQVMLGGDRSYSIARLSAEGAEVSGHSIILAAGASASLVVTETLGSAEVQGIAQRAGRGFSGAMIVLVPQHPEGSHDLFRRDQSDLDGTFVFHNVVPGAYTVVAIENGWDLDWSQPDIIGAYARRGVPLQIGDQAGQNLTLPAPVEVQPK